MDKNKLNVEERRLLRFAERIEELAKNRTMTKERKEELKIEAIVEFFRVTPLRKW